MPDFSFFCKIPLPIACVEALSLDMLYCFEWSIRMLVERYRNGFHQDLRRRPFTF